MVIRIRINRQLLYQKLLQNNLGIAQSCYEPEELEYPTLTALFVADYQIQDIPDDVRDTFTADNLTQVGDKIANLLAYSPVINGTRFTHKSC